MKLKFFPPAILKSVEKALDEELEKNASPVAAFDADGTLWSTDLGENYFQYQIKNSLIPQLPADPWDFYRKMKASGDPRPAYLWLAQIHRGFPLETVQNWATAALASIGTSTFFEEQRQLIDYLKSRGVQIYIVTASVKWSVEPGALALGLPRESVIGVETKVVAGKVSDEQLGFITYREGKVQALLARTGGVRPFFAAGNSPGDMDLLNSATRARLVLKSTTAEHSLFHNESEMQELAKKQNWLAHDFSKGS